MKILGTNEEKQTLKEMYESGSTVSDCAKHFNTSRPTIRKHLLALGVTIDAKPQAKTAKNEDEIVSLYEQGYGIIQITKLVDASQNSVTKILHDKGIVRRDHMTKTKITATKEELERKYWDEGRSFLDISKDYGISNVTLRKWFDELDIQVKNSGERGRYDRTPKKYY